jgi:hypothetical protein
MYPAIMLSTKYEVALTEFVYSNQFDADIGTVKLIRKELYSQDQRNTSTPIKLPEKNTSHVLALNKNINARIKTELYLDFRKECIAVIKDISFNTILTSIIFINIMKKIINMLFSTGIMEDILFLQMILP